MHDSFIRAHNDEARATWDAFDAGRPLRPPVSLGTGTQFFIYSPKEELGVNDFETGFPVDYGRIRRELGPDVTIHGGPTVMILRDGSPDAVCAETGCILDSGVCAGGRFVLREANNLAPRTPFANLAAMYETARVGMVGKRWLI